MRLDDFCYFNRMIPRCIRTSAHTERPSASCVVLENPLEQEGAYNSNHNTVVRQAFYQPLLPSLVAAAGGTTGWSPGPLRYAVAVLYHGTGSSGGGVGTSSRGLVCAQQGAQGDGMGGLKCCSCLAAAAGLLGDTRRPAGRAGRKGGGGWSSGTPEGFGLISACAR